VRVDLTPGVACEFVAARVRERAGARWLQGARRPPIACDDPSPWVRLLAEQRLREVPDVAARALVLAARGARPLDLLASIPSPRDLLAHQARGRRYASILDRDDGLDFLLHDLCHLEKFVDPAHHEGQVGFFSALLAAWDDLVSRYDDAWREDLVHVAADMNGSPIFLFAALKMKLKMAVRRDVARERGDPPPAGGPLLPHEARAFEAALDDLLRRLALPAAERIAASRVTTRREELDAARALDAWLVAIGRERLAAS